MNAYVCIYASQVAMCIGANKHKKVSEALEMMWQRVSPTGFAAAMQRNGQKTEDEQAADIIKAHTEVQGLVDLTMATECDSSDQVAQQYDSIAKELRDLPDLPEEDRKLVDDVLKRNLYTNYGNTHEHRVLTYIRDTLGIQCGEDPTFYKIQAGVAQGAWGSFPWHVGGKIDAIDDKKTLLIEIKNRVNRLFYRVPFYEQVQVQAYLHLLDLDRGVLVECLKTRDNEEDILADTAAARTTVNVIPIKRDRDLWEREIVPKLSGFVDFLGCVVNDTNMQDRYLQSKRRSAMITVHVNAWKSKNKNPAGVYNS